MCKRRGLKSLDGRIPYGTGRFVDHTLEGLVVHRIDNELEVGHHVLYFSPLEEGIAGVHNVRDIASPQLLFEGAGLGVCTVKNSKVLICRPVATHALLDG